MIKVYKRLGWFFKQEWKIYLFMLFLLLGLSIINLMPARLLGNAIDLIATGAITMQSFMRILLLLIAFPILSYCFDFCYHYLINAEGQKLSYLLRKKYLQKLFSMDSKLYEEYTKGELISRVTNDLQSITTAATSLLQQLVYNGSLLFFAILMMIFTISLNLTLVSVTLMPIAFIFLTKKLNKMRKYYVIHRDIYADMTEKVLESIEGVKVVRAYVQEDNDFKKLEESINRDIESWRRIVRFETAFGPMFNLVYHICYFLAFSYGAYLVIHQNITVGQLITFTMYLGMLYGPIIALSNILNGVNNSIVASDRFNQIMVKESEVHDHKDSLPILNFNEIEFRDVTFKYPFDQHNVIDHINFSIRKGETIGIVGPTGAGKSTLIRQLLREFNITEGDIYIDHKPIKQYKIDDVRQLVGYVPQSHVLFSGAVNENILVGNPVADDISIDRAIIFADFKKDLEYLPDGLRTLIGEQGTALSGGQKQRLSIARAIVKDPEILILDDSLSAVDAKTEETIIKHLKEHRSGKTNIIVAHRFSAIQSADKILVLQEGKIVERGKHEDLMKHNGWYKIQFDKQTSMEKRSDSK